MSFLVFGGSGALGRSLIKKLNSVGKKTVCVDLSSNADATLSLIYTTFPELETSLTGHVFDGILCAAGGWTGGSIGPELVNQTITMVQSSVIPAAVCASLCKKHLNPNGHLLLVGAAAVASDGTPGMLAYGMAKASVQHLAVSLSKSGSGMPEGSKVMCLLPITLDTPANRSAMPNADTSSWTDLNDLSEFVLKWTENGNNEYPSGSLVKVETVNHKTAYSLFK